MSYAVKEVFLSLQGEGFHAGRRATFVRFAGCNGWTGREADRDRGPLGCSRWCDTDFLGTDGPGGGHYGAAGLAAACAASWGEVRARRFAVLTGGEPLLQVDRALVAALHRSGFAVAVETNGTIGCPPEVDWITVSPKPGLPLVQGAGHELKLVHPQPGLDPADYLALPFEHRYLQPRWSDDPAGRAADAAATARYCLDHPAWRLGLQAHKFVGLP